jgi:hypothetical protein
MIDQPKPGAPNPKPEARGLRPFLRKALTWTIFCLVIGRLFGFGIFEDAYITFRCAENFADGHGLNYNPGERVESSSAFFYALLVGLGTKLRINPAITAYLLNFAAVFFILFSLARRAPPAGEAGVGLANAGFWFAAFQPGLWAYAHSGMETMFFAGLMFAGFLFALDAIERNAAAWPAGLALGLAAITRMEAVAFAGLAAALVFVLGPRERRWRNGAEILGAFAVIFGPVLAWRWNYYGYPFPISYYVKVDGGGTTLAARGVAYDIMWVVANPLAVLTIVLGVRFVRRRTTIRRRSLLGLAWVGGYAAYNAYVGGDYLPYARFFMPVLPVIAWMIGDQWPLWAARVGAPPPGLAPMSPRRLIALLTVCHAWTLFFPPQFFGIVKEMGTVKGWRQVGEAVHRQIKDRRVTLYVLAAGAMPYYSKLRAYDGLGLTDLTVAHKKVALGRGVPGHEKADITRVFDLRPDIIAYQSYGKDAKLKNLPYYTKTEPKGFVDATGKFHQLNIPKAQAGSTNLVSEHEAMMNFFTDEEFLARYELMRLRDPSLIALFFVRKDAPGNVRRAFEPFSLPGAPESPPARRGESAGG